MEFQVSVIITTRNEEKNIANCLESIKRQSYPQDRIEIIIVDNNSFDNTVEIARKYTNKIYSYGPERSAQRNFGVKQAVGKYILYLDADMILSKDVIRECINKCEDSDYIALYIPERIVGEGFWIRVKDFERSFYNSTCIDAVRFVRRDKFLEIDGFDEDLVGPEDWDFDRRIKNLSNLSITESVIYHNEGKFSLKKYLRKKSYYSRWMHNYIMKWGKSDPIVKKQLGFLYRYFLVFIENGKWKRLFGNPIYVLGMLILRLCVSMVFITSYIRPRPPR